MDSKCDFQRQATYALLFGPNSAIKVFHAVSEFEFCSLRLLLIIMLLPQEIMLKACSGS